MHIKCLRQKLAVIWLVIVLTSGARLLSVVQVCTGVMLHGYGLVKQLCGELQVGLNSQPPLCCIVMHVRLHLSLLTHAAVCQSALRRNLHFSHGFTLQHFSFAAL